MTLPNHTKIWSNIAYATATACFAKAAWAGTASEAVWGIYLAVVGLHVTADQLVRLKFGPPPGGPQ